MISLINKISPKDKLQLGGELNYLFSPEMNTSAPVPCMAIHTGGKAG